MEKKRYYTLLLIPFFIISCSQEDTELTIVDEFQNDFVQASGRDIDLLKGFIETETENSGVWSEENWDFDNIMTLKKPKEYEAFIINQVGVSPNNNENVAMSFIKKDGVMLSSFVTKTISVSESIKKAEYYNVNGDLLFTTEFNNLNKTIRTYRPNSDLDAGIFKRVSLFQETDCEASFGQAVADCLDDIYTKRGFLSVWAWVQTAFIPWTAVAMAIDCAYHNWPSGDGCYDGFGWGS